MKEKDFEFYDGGDGVEYELWRKKGTPDIYIVPIDRGKDTKSGEPNIKRHFAKAKRK